jgi:copper transport protein
LSACKTAGAPTSSKTVGVLFGAVRVLLFVGLALLIGGVVFLFVIARGTSALRQTRRIVWVGWGITLAATIFGVMLQGPYAEGSGIGDATNSTVLKDILKTQYGHVAERRIVLLAIAFVLLLVIGRLRSDQRPPAWLWVSCGVVGGLLAATPGLAGHAGTGSEVWAAVPLDAIHVAAMSVWFGGLFCLLVCALGGSFSGALRRTIGTFSLLAFWCVIALVASGLFAAWRQVGFRVAGYTDTTYGRLLLIKLGAVAAILGLAAVSRAIVQRRKAAPLDAPDSAIAAIDDRTVHGLRRSVAGEIAVGIAVLIVTAILVNAQPARSALAGGPFAKTVPASSQMLISLTVDPARVGKNTVHILTLKPDSTPLASRISAQVRNVSQGIAPITVPLSKLSLNHSLTNDLEIPTPGTWQFIIHALRGGDNDTAVTIDVPIRR